MRSQLSRPDVASREFVDLETRAKKLGISASSLKARVMSGRERGYVFLLGSFASATWNPLPPYAAEKFHDVQWSTQETKADGNAYSVSGWVILLDAARLVRMGRSFFDSAYVLVSDELDEMDGALTLHHREGEPSEFLLEDLYFPADVSSQRAIHPREKASLQRIITAMRLLLRSKDGGNFPSDAKIIDRLLTLYGAAEGISKSNLEEVFATASVEVGNSLKPKAG